MVALYAVANKHLGVTTSYLQVMTFVRSPRTAEMWRVWFFAGLVGGSLIAAFLKGSPSPNLTYGALGDLPPSYRSSLWEGCSWDSEQGGAAAVPRVTGSPVRPSCLGAPWSGPSHSWQPPSA